MKILNYFPALLLLLALSSATSKENASKATAGEKSRESKISREPITLATATYTEGKEKRQLIFIKSTIPSPGVWEMERYFKKHPTQTSFPNTTFSLVDSAPESLTKGNVLLFSYEYDNTALPATIWAADIVRPGEKQNSFLVVMTSKSKEAEFRVFPIDRTNVIATHPISLEPKEYEDWPKKSVPLSQIKQSIEDEHSCGLGSIKTHLKGDQLIIDATREHETCLPVQFIFDLKTKEWTSKASSGTKIVTLQD
jgi:hypothetical protein